jgi:membrane-bound lytic murein transglycosylase B
MPPVWQSRERGGWRVLATRFSRAFTACAGCYAVIVALGVCLCVRSGHAQAVDQSAAGAKFADFIAALWPDAQAAGVARGTFDAAFAGVTLDAGVVARNQNQPEYGKPAGAYVDSIASPARIDNGKRKVAQWTDTFAAVEQKYSVDRWIMMGIWGIESDFGAEKDTWDVIRSLATLAVVSDRPSLFRGELIDALKMLQQNDVGRGAMVGSWAGAMGQPQFMPSNYLQYAVDFTGGGRRDIWTSVPDSLASIANYLHGEGWDPALPWGFEVAVPQGFDYRRSRASFADWKKLGLTRADGAMPEAGDAILFFPSGASGPAFLVTANFNVIKTYNNSDVYALAVGHLGDRIRGAGPIKGTWPSNVVQLSRSDRIALQKKLAALGYKVNDFQAHIDFDLRDAIRIEQSKFGMVPDGNPTPEFLRRLELE